MNLPEDTIALLQDQQLARPGWLAFRRPVETVQARTPAEVAPCLERVERAVESGFHAAGFIGYEAASGLDPAFQTHPPAELPCLWFGLFERCERVELPDDSGKRFSLGEWTPSVSRDGYNRAFDAIKQRIREGDTYQVNYTFRLRSAFQGDPLNFFIHLYRAQLPRYAAFIDLGRYKICSVSPEVFVSLDGERIVSRPMKGTVSRGYTGEQDRENAAWLHASGKNRAENVMIVDMIRNDIGRIAVNGSVDVERLFEVEKYPTVHQMTSTVAARTTAGAADIIKTMFPCASVTGAPKVKTMEIIKDLEAGPRGVYTGSIGYIAPGRRLQFNVAIRTAVLDTVRGAAEYGVGGGITWGSDAGSEYDECRAKAAVLTSGAPGFRLLESLLWDRETGYHLLDGHLRRLEASGAYFDFPVSTSSIRKKLESLQTGLEGPRSKVRLLVARDGTVGLEAAPLTGITGSRVTISTVPVKTDTPFVYHKTDNRKVYTDVVSANGRDGDLLLWNETGRVTETTVANVVVEDQDGVLATPPVRCGLLDGVMRSLLLERGVVVERDVTLDDLRNARRVFLVNSVRGWMRLVREDADTWVVAQEQYYGMSPPEEEHGTRDVVGTGS